MKKGDLVQVKPGCAMQGSIGVLMHDIVQPFTHCMVLFTEGMQEINSYWIEPPRERASSDGHGMISASREK